MIGLGKFGQKLEPLVNRQTWAHFRRKAVYERICHEPCQAEGHIGASLLAAGLRAVAIESCKLQRCILRTSAHTDDVNGDPAAAQEHRCW